MQTVVKDSAKEFMLDLELGSNKGHKIYKVLRYLNLSLENFEFEQNAINESMTYINYFKSASVKLIKS